MTAALTEAGASVADVVRTRPYDIDINDIDINDTDINDTNAVLRAHGEVFGDIRPAAILVQVVALIDPKLLVEIEAYAVIDE